MTTTLRVGVIGASVHGGWARDSHIPAIRAVPELELVAVATNSQQTADDAAAAFGVAKAYVGGRALIDRAEIDVVAVTTRVPDHFELVMAAIAAGKHVVCEWPLGRSRAEAEEMAAAARQAGVHTAIGLQLRAAPAVLRARQLLLAGEIGRLLSVTVSSSTAGFGPKVAAPFLYLEDPSNFANLVSIQSAHTIDLAIALVGGLESASALATTQYPIIFAGDSGEPRARTTFDHLLVHGRLSAGGAALAMEVAGGRPPETPFWLEMTGEHGVLRLDGGAPRGVQSGTLALSLNGQEQLLPASALSALPASAVNVAYAYSSLRNDIASGRFTCAGFDHAAALTRLVEDLLESSRSGKRALAAHWPSD